MKKIGFLSFGHWSGARGSATRSASDVLLQSIELAVAAEELGADGAYFPCASLRAASSPRRFPLLAAVAARTKTHRDRHRRHRHAVRKPALYGRRKPSAADLISLAGGCNSASAVVRRNRWSKAGAISATCPPRARAMPIWAAAMPRCCSHVLKGQGFREAEPAADVYQSARPATAGTAFPRGLRERLWWGAGLQCDCHVDGSGTA